MEKMAGDVSRTTHDSGEIKSHKILDETFKAKPMAWYHENDYKPTSVEFVKDLKWAFCTLMLVLFLGFCFGRVAHACESYEECMDVCGPLSPGNKMSGANCTKAIAYKLDEISRKLDK